VKPEARCNHRVGGYPGPLRFDCRLKPPWKLAHLSLSRTVKTAEADTVSYLATLTVRSNLKDASRPITIERERERDKDVDG
jgi:hypothetical protein